MRDVAKPVLQDFLNKIIPDIEMIDGGCSSCITSFVEGVNETLEEYGLVLNFDEGKVYVEEKG